MKKIGIITLGCARNTVDSEKLLIRLRRKGFTITNPENADYIIINTCGFIDPAKEESIETIRDYLELKEEGKIEKVIVWGCLVKRYAYELAEHLKGVDAFAPVINFYDKDRISLTLPHLADLKIAEGCQNKCSYCAIPNIRGPLKSKTIPEILDEVKSINSLAQVKELTIAAQDTTAWGQDLDSNQNIVDLLKAIVKEATNIPWIRIMYAHPRFTTPEIIDYIANEAKICSYLDLPIQHINDRMLNLMNRHTNKKDIIKILKHAKKYPDFVFRTTLISGLPSETEDEFNEVLEFIEEYPFRNLGAFIYSKEEDTPCYDMQQMDEKLKNERHNTLMMTQQDISLALNQTLIGKEFDVLVDEYTDDTTIARTYFQAHDIDGVTLIDKELEPGRFYKVKIIDATEYDLIAETI